MLIKKLVLIALITFGTVLGFYLVVGLVGV
jgi:hypothetical protein